MEKKRRRGRRKEKKTKVGLVESLNWKRTEKLGIF